MGTAPALANVLRPRGDFAIIGPGGGADALRAVANGSPKVTGIEINRSIVNNIMRGRYAKLAYHLYEMPEVNIHIADGCTIIRKTPNKYAVLQMSMLYSCSSTVM